MTKTTDLYTLLGQNYTVDVQDMIDRLKDIEDSEDPDEVEEAQQINDILDDLRGDGGDVQYLGEWYPQTLIDSTYFTEYCEETLTECYNIDTPPCVVIDWDATASNMKCDYTTIEIEGTTWYYR